MKEKSRWLPVQAAVLAVLSLKRSSPVARKLSVLRPARSGAQAISDYLGANGKGLMLNVTDPASIESVLENVRAEFGEVDILVNNAGITRDNLSDAHER